MCYRKERISSQITHKGLNCSARDSELGTIEEDHISTHMQKDYDKKSQTKRCTINIFSVTIYPNVREQLGID